MTAADTHVTASPGDAWKRWVARFWFLRGVAAAISLTLLVPNFTDLSRFQFLRAVYALIVEWKEWFAWLGRLIGKLPWLPDVSAEMVGALMFAVSVGLPGGIAAWVYLWKRLEYWPSRLRAVAWAVEGLAALWQAFSVPVAALLTFLYAVGAEISPQPIPGVFGLSVGALSLAFLGACVILKGFFQGVVLLLTFILTFVILYWLGTPGLADWVNATAEAALAK